MPYATMADAHREWHTNTGVPMGTPGCPQDACHPAEEYDHPLYSIQTPYGVEGFDTYAEAKAGAISVAKMTGKSVLITKHLEGL